MISFAKIKNTKYNNSNTLIVPPMSICKKYFAKNISQNTTHKHFAKYRRCKNYPVYGILQMAGSGWVADTTSALLISVSQVLTHT